MTVMSLDLCRFRLIYHCVDVMWGSNLQPCFKKKKKSPLFTHFQHASTFCLCSLGNVLLRRCVICVCHSRVWMQRQQRWLWTCVHRRLQWPLFLPVSQWLRSPWRWQDLSGWVASPFMSEYSDCLVMYQRWLFLESLREIHVPCENTLHTAETWWRIPLIWETIPLLTRFCFKPFRLYFR